MACLYPKTAISALFAIWTSFYHYKVTQLQCKHCWVCLFGCFLLLKQMKFVEKFLFSVRELFQSLRPNESVWKLIPRLRHASSLSSNTQINIFDTWHFFFPYQPKTVGDNYMLYHSIAITKHFFRYFCQYNSCWKQLILCLFRTSYSIIGVKADDYMTHSWLWRNFHYNKKILSLSHLLYITNIS